MRALALVAVLAGLPLSGCTTFAGLTTHKACTEAVKASHTVQDVATIAIRHGIRPDDARKLGEAAVHGEDVATTICSVVDAIGL